MQFYYIYHYLNGNQAMAEPSMDDLKTVFGIVSCSFGLRRIIIFATEIDAMNAPLIFNCFRRAAQYMLHAMAHIQNIIATEDYEMPPWIFAERHYDDVAVKQDQAVLDWVLCDDDHKQRLVEQVHDTIQRRKTVLREAHRELLGKIAGFHSAQTHQRRYLHASAQTHRRYICAANCM